MAEKLLMQDETVEEHDMLKFKQFKTEPELDKHD